MDRDPSLFTIILKFLRSGKLADKVSSEVLSELQEEAEYFQLTSLQEMISHRLESAPLKLVVIEADNKGGQIKHYISARRSWFGNVPLPVVATILDIEKYEQISVPKLMGKVESINHDTSTVDEDGNICIYNEDPKNVLDVIFEMKNGRYISEKAIALVYMRDYYFSGRTEFNLKISEGYCEEIFTCKLSAFSQANIKVFDENGCSSVDVPDDCPPKGLIIPTLEEAIERILSYLEDERVGDVEPPQGTEWWNDSYNAQWMGLLDDKKWFC